MTRVACIGECMIELKQAESGLFSRGYGGDTLNTAVYLARLGVGADYITALGDDPLSDEMISGWPRDFVTDRALKLGFTTAEKTFDDIIRIHIEDELGGKFAG